MVIQEDRIRLIHENRTALLNRMFDELSRKPPDSSVETVFHEIITTARVIQNALSKSEEIQGAIRKGYTEATRTHSAAIDRHTHQVCIETSIDLRCSMPTSKRPWRYHLG